MSDHREEREELARELYRLEWDADLYATPRGAYTERYERRADRLISAGYGKCSARAVEHSAGCPLTCACWQRRAGCKCHLWDRDCPQYSPVTVE